MAYVCEMRTSHDHVEGLRPRQCWRAKLRRYVCGLRQPRPRPAVLQRAVQKPTAAQPGPGSWQALSGKQGRKAGPLPEAAGLPGSPSV
jgi:hypothetical protein